MALPKRKTSKGRKKRRRSAISLDLPTLTKCPECGAASVAHEVCKKCGTYNGVQVLKR